jgi:hypothetical protein
VLDVRFPEDEDYTSVQYIKNYYEQGMPVFPARELAPGDSWTQTTKVVLPGEPMEASVSYKVTALVREAGYDCAVIECDGQLFIPIEPNPKDTVQRTGLDNIKSTGKLYFAYKEGMVVLQRERWVIDRHRKLILPDKTEEFREAVELDVDFALKSRMAVDSLAI